MNESILEMIKISKSFGGLHALSDVNLDLQKGEILGLVGDNAAGKSTLMKILTGAYVADTGTIAFQGQKVNIPNPRVSKKLGIEMVYQDLELVPNLNVPLNFFLGRELSNKFIPFLKKREMEKKAMNILEKLKIEIDDPNKQVNRLSGGQQQAVAIGKAVSFNPKIVIMDEPTANLAHVEIGKVLELTLRLKEQGISIIFISHRLDDIFKVTDRIFIMKHGFKVDIKETAKTNVDEILQLMFK